MRGAVRRAGATSALVPAGSAGLLAAGLLVALLGAPAAVAQEVSLVAGGDVEWSREVKAPDVFWHSESGDDAEWRGVPLQNRAETRGLVGRERGRVYDRDAHHSIAIEYGLEFPDGTEMARYPWREIRPVFREADVAFVNLESPLSDDARWSGAFRTPTAFAGGLRWAGIDVVSTANNHSLDAEGEGLRDTREALFRAGVGAVGTGGDLEAARRPHVVERSGVRIAFLAYAQFVNAGSSAFAQPDRSGVAPLDPLLIEEDIRRVRDQVDWVVVSFHWGLENEGRTHPEARRIAHETIDAGADVILGHHSHVPKAVELYGDGVIFYSLGNLIFGHNHDYWGDNIVAEIRLGPGEIREIRVHPVAGEANEPSRPHLLGPKAGRDILSAVDSLSAEFGTRLRIEDGVGTVVGEDGG